MEGLLIPNPLAILRVKTLNFEILVFLRPNGKRSEEQGTDTNGQNTQLLVIPTNSIFNFSIMPIKPFKQIQLHPEQPDCCNECPLLGLIPEAEREFGSQETLVCLGTRHALNARIARSRKSEHTPKHPLKRWCDDEWERWQEEPYFGKLPVRKIDVSRYRDPWERSQQLPIIFHNKRGRKPKSK